jgi:hypothetical protein
MSSSPGVAPPGVPADVDADWARLGGSMGVTVQDHGIAGLHPLRGVGSGVRSARWTA